MPSPILARADALMQRRRQSAGDQNDLPVLTDAIENDDDLPVLNDIANDSAPALAEVAPPADRVLAEHELSGFDRKLADQVQERILAQLPQLIESAIKAVLAEREIARVSRKHD